MNIDIELFPLQKPGSEPFDIKKFYANIISIDPDEVTDASALTSTKIMEISRRIRQKEYKKRILGRAFFQIAPEMKFGIKFYTMIIKAKKPTSVPLDAKTNKRLNNITKKLCAETGQDLYDE